MKICCNLDNLNKKTIVITENQRKDFLENIFELSKKNYPNTLINECITNINELITEEYGINDDLVRLAGNLEYEIINSLQQVTEITPVDNGLTRRNVTLEFNSSDDIFYDLKNIINKFTDFKLVVIVNNFNFKSQNYYDEFIKKYVSADSISTTNFNVKKDNGNKSVISTIEFGCVTIKGKFTNETYNSLFHELSHCFQQMNIGSEYTNTRSMARINMMLFSENENIKNLGRLLYYCDNGEQDSMINGLYAFVIKNQRNINNEELNEIIKKDMSFKTIIELKRLVNWIKSLDQKELKELLLFNRIPFKNNEELIRYIEKQQKRFDKKIARCILKIKKDLGLLKGYNQRVESYFCHLPLIFEEDYFTPEELLTETKTDNLIFEQYLIEANLNDIYTKYYSNIPENEFWDIIKADPTYNPQKQQKMGKFGKWLLNLYKQNKLRLEDLYKATDYLSYFVKYYNKIENKDINRIPDLPSLFNVIKPFKEASDNGEEMATSKSDEIRRIK